jgi:hypothetical protein
MDLDRHSVYIDLKNKNFIVWVKFQNDTQTIMKYIF